MSPLIIDQNPLDRCICEDDKSKSRSCNVHLKDILNQFPLSYKDMGSRTFSDAEKSIVFQSILPSQHLESIYTISFSKKVFTCEHVGKEPHECQGVSGEMSYIHFQPSLMNNICQSVSPLNWWMERVGKYQFHPWHDIILHQSDF